MVIYWYPFFLALICSLILWWAFAAENKKWAITASILPVFFASPFITVTRGAAGAITCSDMSGIALFVGLLFFPKKWRSTQMALPAWPFVVLFFILLMSVWTSGLFYNFIGIKNSQVYNIRIATTSLLPIYIAGFRSFKLISLVSYCVFYYNLSMNDEIKQLLIRLIIIGAVLVSISKILTLLGFIDLSLSYGDTEGVYIGPRILGHAKAAIGRYFFMGILLCLACYDKISKLWLTIFLVLLSSGLVLAGSRAGIIALVVSFVPIYILGRVKGLVIGVFTLSVIVCAGLWALSFSDLMRDMLAGTFKPNSIATASTRIPIWKATVSLWIHSPVILFLGVGAFNFSYAGLPLHFEHAHNDILTICTELGITGAFVYLIVIFIVCVSLFKMVMGGEPQRRWFYLCLFSMFVGLMVASMFEPTFYPTISSLPMLRVTMPLLFAVCQMDDLNENPVA